MKAEEYLKSVEVYYPERDSFVVNYKEFEILQQKMEEEGLDFDLSAGNRFQLKQKET